MKQQGKLHKLYLFLLVFALLGIVTSCKTCECPAYSKEQNIKTKSEFLAVAKENHNIIIKS